MGWLEQLQQASFRGVTFQVDTSTDYVGREKVLREYPFQDLPTIQDMGGVSKPGSFSAYVFGEDCFERRDALIRALNKPGAGDLVHPWMGLMRVEIIGAVPVRHSTQEGGVVRFDIEFCRAEATRYPQATANTSRTVLGIVNQARLNAIIDFARRFNVDGITGWAVVSSLGAVSQAVTAINDAVGSMITKPVGLVAFETQIRLFRNVLGELIYTPESVAGGILGLMNSLSDIGDNRLGQNGSTPSDSEAITMAGSRFVDGLNRQQTLFDWHANYSASPYSTPTRTQEQDNYTAIETLVQVGSVLAVAETISSTDFTQHWNYVEAMQWRNTLNIAFQHLLERSDSVVYQDIANLMAGVSNDLVTRSRHLGRVTAIQTRNVHMPALLVSYEQYGDINYADEIVRNNRIQHPLFIEPASTLELISHA